MKRRQDRLESIDIRYRNTICLTEDPHLVTGSGRDPLHMNGLMESSPPLSAYDNRDDYYRRRQNQQTLRSMIDQENETFFVGTVRIEIGKQSGIDPHLLLPRLFNRDQNASVIPDDLNAIGLRNRVGGGPKFTDKTGQMLLKFVFRPPRVIGLLRIHCVPFCRLS